jgi:hypothetical protein
MRLYTLTGAAQVDDPQYGTFTANPDGSFDFPNELSDKLHSFHAGGKPAWETDAERELRVAREELERFRDPAELLKAVKEMGANQSALTAALATALGLQPAPVSPAPSESAPAAVDSQGPAESEPAVRKTTRRSSK